LVDYLGLMEDFDDRVVDVPLVGDVVAIEDRGVADA
jgi:hypothetical protein